MVKDYFTAKDVAQILDIYECSAQELLDGVIAFEPDELLILANAAEVTVERLIK